MNGGDRVEIIEADSPEELNRKIEEFTKPKENSNNINARASVPGLYDMKVMDTKIIQDKDGNVRYIVAMRY